MFKLLGVAAVALMVAAMPAKADNSEEVIIGVMGGGIGGLVLGEVLERPRYNPAPIYRAPVEVDVYEYEEPVMVRRCRTKYVRYYDYMGNLVRKPVRKCVWVERY